MPGTAVPNDVAVRGWHAVRAGIGGGGEWGWQVTGGRIGDEAVGKEIGVGRGGGEPFFEGGGVEAIFAEDDGELDAALAGTYLRNARGMLIRRRWAAGTALARRAWGLSRDPAQRREIAGLLPFGVKRFLRGLMPG